MHLSLHPLFPTILPTSVLCFTHLSVLPDLLSSPYPILGGACSCVVMVLTISFREAYLPGIMGCQPSLSPQTLGLEFRAANINTCPSEQMESGTLTHLPVLSSRAITATCSVTVVNPQSQLNYFRAKHTVFVKYFSLINL